MCGRLNICVLGILGVAFWPTLGLASDQSEPGFASNPAGIEAASCGSALLSSVHTGVNWLAGYATHTEKIEALRRLAQADALRGNSDDFFYINKPTSADIIEFQHPRNAEELEASLMLAWLVSFYYDLEITLLSGEKILSRQFEGPPVTRELRKHAFDQLASLLRAGVRIVNSRGERITEAKLEPASISLITGKEIRLIPLSEISLDGVTFIRKQDAPTEDLSVLNPSRVADLANIRQLQTTTQLNKIKNIFSDGGLKPIKNEEIEVGGCRRIIMHQNWLCAPGIYLQIYRDYGYWGSDDDELKNIRIVVDTSILDRSDYIINQSTMGRGSFQSDSIRASDRNSVARFLWFRGVHNKLGSSQEEIIFSGPIPLEHVREIVVISEIAKDAVLHEIAGAGRNASEWRDKIRVLRHQ